MLLPLRYRHIPERISGVHSSSDVDHDQYLLETLMLLIAGLKTKVVAL